MARRKTELEKAQERALKYAKRIEDNCPELAKCSRNLTAMYLEGKLDEVYHRDATIANIQKILLRKSKANVLLTGPAGCGKTAIAERLAAVLTNRLVDYAKTLNECDAEYDKAMKAYNNADYADNIPRPIKEEPPAPWLSNCVVFDLSLTALTGGTRYRGDFEEKVNNLLAECRKHPNIILFIDEIHQIVSAGKCEGGEGAAQMLKPALARRDICVVGATTTDEAKYIWEDKALARRFNEVKVNPLAGNAAHSTAEGILQDYAKYHEIEAPIVDVPQIMNLLDTFLPHTVFPDNFINVVDETLAGAKFDGHSIVDMTHYKATISRMAGVVIV